jgi:Ca2+-binding RTX toxin-like protein
MSIITDYFKQAELALAAYAELDGVNFIDPLKEAGMSDAQARRFARDWRVVEQYTHTEQTPIYDDGGNITGYLTTSNGLTVTVFQEVSTGKRYLAIRGTEATSGSDLWTDLKDLVAIGTPDHQSQYQSLKAKVTEWIGNGTLPASFTVAGHSLGGFLSAALAIDFPLNVAHAYLYNAPGVGGVRANLELALQILGGLPEGSRTLNLSTVSNLRAASGASLVAGLGQAWGTPVSVEIEAASGLGLGNHSIVRLTDALAIHAAYAVLAPSLTLAQTGQLLCSAAERNANSLEAGLDALRKTLLGADVTATTEENRESLYANLYALQGSAAYLALRGSAAVRLTATQDAATLAANARTDFGSFLAIKHLLPIRIEGAVGTLSGVHADLYTQWQADRTLTPQQRASGQANFSDEYLADRAAFLAWKLKLALEDADASTTAYNQGGATDQWFRDNATNLTINLGSGAAPTKKRRFIFGADQSSGTETLSGGSQADNLYGGGGDDTLYGFDGHDHLEGGAGADQLEGGDGNDVLVGGVGNDTLTGGKDNDTLRGGAGLDTYAFTSGDGWDWIEDADGLGRLTYAGLDLVGGANVAANAWKQTTPDGKTFLYSLETRTENGQTFSVLTIQAPGAGGGIRIKGWQPGQLGIDLADAVAPPILPPANIAPATRQTAWHGEDHAVIEEQAGQLMMLSAVGDYGEVQGDGQLIGNGSDNYLYERVGGGSDELRGEGGRDSLIATGGNDRLFGGDDDDVLHGGDDDDLLEGGEGSDVLAGGSGADVLMGGNGADFLFGTGTYYGARSDWSFTYDAGTNTLVAHQVFGAPFLADDAADLLRGGAGNDFLFGGGGADQLFGEADDDRLEGSAGDDYLSGGDGADILRGDMTEGAGMPNPGGGVWHNPPEFHGNDILDGGAGDDRLYGAGGADELRGGDGDDELSGDDAALPIAYQGADLLEGGAGNDRLFGDGDDIPVSQQGDDYLDGGAGDDYLRGYGGKSQSPGDGERRPKKLTSRPRACTGALAPWLPAARAARCRSNRTRPRGDRSSTRPASVVLVPCGR